MAIHSIRQQVVKGVIGAMLAISAYGLAAVPAGVLIAIHWGLDGTPDGWAPREIGLLVIPAIASVLAILLLALPSVEPRRAHLARSGPCGPSPL